ncbi:glycosyltransferase [Lacticaseibacillus paracasei]|jgi:UDP-N-acetylglucosamine transferase subunit ALG13|uniref:glycosyltransferase n=1 Tax=Lacticaseibacillus paracasei TaxID=1597 RepID=UPI001F602A96|nr:glycosyltransferase [Lacticaseibacillus paracasei]MEA0973653.1 glycosyltransferase [Lacticaseibacillus paracasei]
MIFVTVGTHEQPFNRLMKAIDEFAVTERKKEEIIVQYGFSTEVPKHVTDAQPFFSNVEMNRLISKARILITHGGPSTIIEGLQLKKPTIVVPRQKKFDEHVNDHQLLFSREMKKMNYPMIVIEDVAGLSAAVGEAPTLLKKKPFISHTEVFNRELKQMLDQMF